MCHHIGNYGLSSHHGKMKISEIKSHENLENEFAMIYGEKGNNELSKFHNGYKRWRTCGFKGMR